MAQIGFFNFVDVNPVIADFTVRNVVKPVNQVCNRGLARAGCADKCDFLTRLCPKADVVENQLVFVIAEVHVVKDHAALHLGVGNGAVRLVRVFPSPKVRALGHFHQVAVFVFLRVDKFDITLVLFGLLVHKVEHTLCAGRRRNNEVNLHADLGNRLREALVKAYKGDHRAERNARQVVDAENRADNRDHRVADPADVRVDRH